MQTYEQIQWHVGERNDAAQEGPDHLSAIAPLMGVVEGLGNLAGPNGRPNNALGSLAVMVCDYCCRIGVQFPTRVELAERDKLPALNGVLHHLGRLFQCHRDEAMAKAGLMDALRGFVWHLEQLAREHTKVDLLTLLNTQWNAIQKERP